jgi:hypothetical protein
VKQLINFFLPLIGKNLIYCFHSSAKIDFSIVYGRLLKVKRGTVAEINGASELTESSRRLSPPTLSPFFSLHDFLIADCAFFAFNFVV